MIRGVEAAANGMKSIMELNDVQANNLANVNTTGYKQSVVVFKNIHDVAVNKITTASQRDLSDNSSRQVGTISAGSAIMDVVTDFSQGTLKPTGNPLDIGINGKGFFKVRSQNGDFYTRNGAFYLDNNGYLRTLGGDQLLGQGNAPIQIKLEGAAVSNINISTDGFIEVNKNRMGKIYVADFFDYSNLKPVGNTYFAPADPKKNPEMAAKKFELSQSSLETSNANVVETMISNMSGMRVYETLSTAIQQTSRTLEKGVNQVGRLIR